MPNDLLSRREYRTIADAGGILCIGCPSMPSRSDQPSPEDHAPPAPPAQELTLALQAVRRGDARAADGLLEKVYDELRELARARMAHEPGRGAGMTLDPTALVHEAYLRVIGEPANVDRPAQRWENRGHFFAAAALAMRRILVERARHRRRLRHGGGRDRAELVDDLVASPAPGADGTDLIALDEALRKLEGLDPRKAQVVSLRYFAGLTVEETADALDLSPATVKNDWAFARAWLHRELSGAK
jgi:RNA polymerase sigma factor (TIGR02999 family)